MVKSLTFVWKRIYLALVFYSLLFSLSQTRSGCKALYFLLLAAILFLFPGGYFWAVPTIILVLLRYFLFREDFPGPTCLPLPSFYMMFYYLSLPDITWIVPVSSIWKSKSWVQAFYFIQSCITSDSIVPGVWKDPKMNIQRIYKNYKI